MLTNPQLILLGLGSLIAGAIFFVLLFFRMVPSGEAHVVTKIGGKVIITPDEKIKDRQEKNWYLEIPLIRTVRELDLKTQEINIEFETYEISDGRFNVSSSLKYRIENPRVASETFTDFEELHKQMVENIKSAVIAVTKVYEVSKARANKEEMSNKVEEKLRDDLAGYGAVLVTFVLVDFKDTTESKIISNISLRREKEIETQTREEIAEKDKRARIKEAESLELAELREIAKTEAVEKRGKEREMNVFLKHKETERARLDVEKTTLVETEENKRQSMIVDAKKRQEIAQIEMDTKEKEGRAERLKAEQMAIGTASTKKEEGLAEAEAIKARGLAEAEALEEKQKALKNFDDKAIRALVAERLVQMELEVGKETAKALANAKISLFSGNTGSSGSGFEMGKMLEAMRVGSPGLAESIQKRLENPLGTGVLSNIHTPPPQPITSQKAHDTSNNEKTTPPSTKSKGNNKEGN